MNHSSSIFNNSLSNLQRNHIVNKSTLIAVVAGLISATAFGQEATPAPELQRFVSTTSRAEVNAATAQATRAGLMARNDADIERIAGLGFVSQKTRAQVQAETNEARRLGLMAFGEGAAPLPSAEQLEAIRIAGVRAMQATQLAARQ